ALAGAPDIAARAVLTALAREAAGAAVRGVALRGAAVARATGADDDTAAKAAREVVLPIADALQHEAVKLLLQMLEA
ncbi:MAG: hypothetical protein ACRD0U_12390, partial [Acidimicrobiales bacterium]